MQYVSKGFNVSLVGIGYLLIGTLILVSLISALTGCAVTRSPDGQIRLEVDGPSALDAMGEALDLYERYGEITDDPEDAAEYAERAAILRAALEALREGGSLREILTNDELLDALGDAAGMLATEYRDKGGAISDKRYKRMRALVEMLDFGRKQVRG